MQRAQKRGADDEAIGRSRGGPSTKINQPLPTLLEKGTAQFVIAAKRTEKHVKELGVNAHGSSFDWSL
jgi:hypothetical protein